jgi:hypothetical protein
MAENKTKPTKGSVEEFLNKVPHDQKRADGFIMLQMMEEVTGEQPRMWGPSIVGFGTYHYKYESGREGDSLMVGFSPRKASLTIYIMPGFEKYDRLMEKLGKYKTGKCCLYINKLADVDTMVLKELVKGSYDYMQQKYHG